MQRERSPGSPSVDRRVQRSRAALMAAAVRLVSERGTTAIAVTDLTEAADVSRKLLYMHFGDRDALFVFAALDLVQKGLDPQVGSGLEDVRERVLTVAGHFAAHRSFYRAMLTGSCAFAMTTALSGLFGALSRTTVQGLFGELDQYTLDDLAMFFAGGAVAVVNDWLTGGGSADPEELADRLLRVASVLGSNDVRLNGGLSR